VAFSTPTNGSQSSAQQRAGGWRNRAPPTTQTPRRPIGAGGGEERAAQARRPCSPHTLSLRGKSSANRAMALLVLPPADHLWIGRNRGNSRVISAMQIDDQLTTQNTGRDLSNRTRAAYSDRRSSNANSLGGQNSLGFPQIWATFQTDNFLSQVRGKHFPAPTAPAAWVAGPAAQIRICSNGKKLSGSCQYIFQARLAVARVVWLCFAHVERHFDQYR
jgi:hypothetical protein